MTMAQLNELYENKNTIRCICRFLAIGMLGTLIDISIYTVLHVWLGVPTLVANTVSYSAGIINNYILHRNWTYAHQARKEIGVQFSQFAMASLSALMLNNLLVLLLTPSLGALVAHAGYGALLAKICATSVGVCWNFLANTFWTFCSPPQRV